MTKNIDSSTNFHKSTFPFLVIILFSGVFLRFSHYFNNLSLWENEVFPASRLTSMNFSKTATLSIDYQQIATIKSCWPCKPGVSFFCKKELSLHLFSLIFGMLASFSFVPVARYFVKSKVSFPGTIDKNHICLLFTPANMDNRYTLMVSA